MNKDFNRDRFDLFQVFGEFHTVDFLTGLMPQKVLIVSEFQIVKTHFISKKIAQKFL